MSEVQFKREPALWLALIATAVQMVSAFVLPLTEGQQGVLNAVAVAIAGLITAVIVKSDQMVPAILAVLKALIALGLAFGWALSPEAQSTIMSFAAAAAAMFVRTQVDAPAPPQVSGDVHTHSA